MKQKKEVPGGVKAISVLYYISAVLGVIFGLLFLFGAGAIANLVPGIGMLGGGIFAIIGLVIIGLSVLGFFIGKGLWNGKNWARIIAIVFSAIGVVVAIISMFQGNVTGNLITLALNGLVGGYLLISEKVKKVFS
jgi:uncharacterized membrane protein (DUF2068 family)